jgi:hypothetical protein
MQFFGIFLKYFYHQNPFIQFLILFLIHKSIRIDFLLLYLISAQEIVLARPPLFFSSPAATHLLPPFPAQSARLLPLTDRWAHPISEPGHLPPPARAAAARLVGCHRSAHRRPSLSHTRMEVDGTVAPLPSLSCTSSVPHRLPSLNQCRNRRVQNPPPPVVSDPSPRLPGPIKGTPRPRNTLRQPSPTHLLSSAVQALRRRAPATATTPLRRAASSSPTGAR